jgi:hypothetical protein
VVLVAHLGEEEQQIVVLELVIIVLVLKLDR